MKEVKEVKPASRRRLRQYIRKTDIDYFGPTKKCPSCRAILGEVGRHSHSQECRERIFAAKEDLRPQADATVQRAIAAAKALCKYNSHRAHTQGSSSFHVLHYDLEDAAASLLDEKLRVAVLDLVIEVRKRFTNLSSYRGPAKQILEILSQGALEASTTQSGGAGAARALSAPLDAAGAFTAATTAGRPPSPPPAPAVSPVRATVCGDQSAQTGDGRQPAARRAISLLDTLFPKVVVKLSEELPRRRKFRWKAGILDKALATAPGAGKEKGLTDEVRKVLLAASDDLANVDRNQSRGTANYNAAWEALEEVTELLE